jgi:hypothetical protein
MNMFRKVWKSSNVWFLLLIYCQKQFPEIILSIDTFRSNVAEQAINAGAQNNRMIFQQGI